MTDDTTLTNPSIPRYGAPTPKEDTLFTDFTQVAGSLFKDKHKNRQTQKIREDLVRDYIAKPDPDSSSVFRKKSFGFLKAKWPKDQDAIVPIALPLPTLFAKPLYTI